MKIVNRRTEEIIPYENNPRYNDQAVDVVANSIKEFGFKNPILITKDNVIIAGHTRLKAAKKLGIEFVPTIMIDDLTPEQIRQFRIADNKTGEFSEWDFFSMAKEFEDLQELDVFLDFGFDSMELENISTLINLSPIDVKYSEDYVHEVDSEESAVGFVPKTNPSQGRFQYTDEQVTHADKATKDRFVQKWENAQQLRKIACPHCGEEFEIYI